MGAGYGCANIKAADGTLLAHKHDFAYWADCVSFDTIDYVATVKLKIKLEASEVIKDGFTIKFFLRTSAIDNGTNNVVLYAISIKSSDDTLLQSTKSIYGRTGTNSLTILGFYTTRNSLIVLSYNAALAAFVPVHGSAYSSYTDTKYSAASGNSSSKLYLVGTPTQSSNGVRSYSNSAVYTANGTLYSNFLSSVSDTTIGGKLTVSKGVYNTKAPMGTCSHSNATNNINSQNTPYRKLFTFTITNEKAIIRFLYSGSANEGPFWAIYTISLPYCDASTTKQAQITCEQYFNTDYAACVTGIKAFLISSNAAHTVNTFEIWSTFTGTYHWASTTILSCTGTANDVITDFRLASISDDSNNLPVSSFPSNPVETYTSHSTDASNNGGLIFPGYVIFTSGAGNSASDIRHKINVQEMPSILNELRGLPIITYTWNKEGEPHYNTLGVSAQELENRGGIWGRLVHTRDNEEQTRFLDYDRFGVIACKAIQEQQEIIDAQSKEIDELKSAVEILTARLNALETKLS